MKCEYCGSENQAGQFCSKCSACLPEENGKIDKSEPFFYNGYICYYLWNRSFDLVECQFWLGMELIERISISCDFLQEKVPPQEDTMPFFWELFLLAKGEIDKIEWSERNKKYPASFVVTRSENKELQRLRKLSNLEIATEMSL